MKPVQSVSRLLLSLRHNLTSTLVALFFAAVIIQLIGAYMSSNIDDGDWEQFKADHDCRPFIDDEGSQRLSWQCNDGKIYHRWRQQR